ncbi:MAG TPA: (2Fe-2S) ferredoxin domain-containing protein, partial [Nitrolancea sp.]|nr:(2Fe-2S) ferredoxin domain-containing protein [Nitrolancea sp.]
MVLNDRAAFERYAAEAVDKWASRGTGNRWVVSVGISECSLAKRADLTMENFRFTMEREGLSAEIRRVGCAGWCWAEPFVEIQSPGQPPIVYANITTDRVPVLVAALKRGDAMPEWAIGVRSDRNFSGIAPLDQHPFLAGQRRILFAEAGVIDPES